MTQQSAPKRFGALLAVYLLGIFMGAIDTGIITPVSYTHLTLPTN
jgi:hypothetical protein